MPNWCQNRVSIYCENTDVIDEIEKIFNSSEPFNTIVPMPEEMEPEWYDWRIANWGVKWDVADVESERDDTHLTLFFDTPWGPPDRIKSALEDMFEEAGISWFYDEPMMELAGYLE